MKHRRPIFILVPLAILLLPLGIYIADLATSSDLIARNVTVDDVPVGGLNNADATVLLEVYEDRLRASTGVFTVKEATFKLSPVEIGLKADIAAAVRAASEARTSGGVLSNFASWLVSFSKTENVPLDITFDEDSIESVFDAWEAAALPNAAFEGSVDVVDGIVTPAYPRDGEAIDRAFARTQIDIEMKRLDKSGVIVPVVTMHPTLTKQQIDAAAAELTEMISDSIRLVSSEVGFRVTFTPAELASAAIARPTVDGASIDTAFDAESVLAILEPRRTEYEILPINAQVDVDLETDVITVIPGRSGTLLDLDGLLVEMKATALGTGNGDFPLLVGARPDLTTEDAQVFTTLVLLGGFTTKHPANQDRVVNIQLMADAVDGAIVMPGDNWSINGEVGERTEAKGYLAAAAIINGEPYCCDHPANIGGGVSQFGTTMFNAIFFSCLEDVEHRPHSLYFSRYPIGREATLGVPGPDVEFRNNTDSPVMIKTAYTATSITVKMYGDNGGLVCTDDTHEQEDIVEYEEELVADEEGVLKPGEHETDRAGKNGFLQKVDRIVTYPDGRQEIDLNLVWRYRPLTKRIIVHPCEITGEPVNCPVQLPSMIGRTWEEALAALQEIGLLASKNTGFVDSAEQHNIVLTQDPAPNEWVASGSTISLTVGEFSEN